MKKRQAGFNRSRIGKMLDIPGMRSEPEGIIVTFFRTIFYLFFIAFLSVAIFCSKSNEEEVDYTQLFLVGSNYTDNNNGTVTDSTGVIWMKCSDGQIWNPTMNNCQGTGTPTVWGAKSYIFCSHAEGLACNTAAESEVPLTANEGPAYEACNALIFAGQTDWRMPTRIELAAMATTVADRGAFLIIFPETPDDKYFWSSSGSESELDMAYAVSFASASFATETPFSKTEAALYVRCVRR